MDFCDFIPKTSFNLKQKRKGAIKIAISTNEILIPKRLFRGKVDKELELDTALSDFCPDVARLIRVDCTPFIEKCEIQGDKAVAGGKAVYDVLYEADYKNKLKFCSFTQEFNHSIPLPKSNANELSAFCTAKCERINCKLLSPRRMVIKAGLGLDFEIEGETPLQALAVVEDGEAFFRKKAIGFEGRTAHFTENYSFEDSIALSRNEKSVGDIVFGSISLQEPQISLSPARAEIKTTAEIQVLCEEESDEGKYFISSKSIPISMDFNNEAIADFKQISVSLEPLDSHFTPELDQYGENRIIKADFSVKTVLKTTEPKAYTVAEDVFEKNFDSLPVTASASLPLIHSRQEHSFTAEAKLEEFLPTPQQILQASARKKSVSVTTEEEGASLNGGFVLTLLTQTTEGIYSFDRDIDFQQLLRADLPEGEFDVNAEVYPIEVITNLHSDGSITAKIIAGARITVGGFAEETFIADLTKRTQREAESDPASLIYRFIQQGEDLWSVAKSYRVSPESIANTNPQCFDENGKFICEDGPILIKL